MALFAKIAGGARQAFLCDTNIGNGTPLCGTLKFNCISAVVQGDTLICTYADGTIISYDIINNRYLSNQKVLAYGH